MRTDGNGFAVPPAPNGVSGAAGAGVIPVTVVTEGGLAVPSAPVQYTFSGIALYRPQFFADCAAGAFPLKPLLLRSMAAGRCSAELYRGLWEDVGTPRLATISAPRWCSATPSTGADSPRWTRP